jgi:ATP-dependent exoDNAse (exonuclease V) alpha subunit
MTSELFKDNYEAKCAYQILKSTNQPVFLTGRAGTGKSTFIDWARTITEKCLVLAPTGVSALNIGGRTIHSMFNLPNRTIYPNDYKFFATHKIKAAKREEIRQSELIIIDEISMINSSVIFCIDQILRRQCGTREIFGGKKILLIGDPLQLPPVLDSKSEIKSELTKNFGGEYFFHSELFQHYNPIKIELQYIYRQNDHEFRKILNDIREGENVQKAITILNGIWLKRNLANKTDEESESINLTFTNKAAKDINDARLRNLPGDEVEFEATITDDFETEGTLIEKIVKIKIGAKVMCIRNHTSGKYVNGTLGTIKAIDGEIITIEDSEGKHIEIKQTTWLNEQKVFKQVRGRKREEIKILGSCKQIPIRLGWAITVHKSQGLTFDRIDLQNTSRVFSVSLIYVALSRCTTLEGIQLAKMLSVSDIQIDERMYEFYKKLTGKEELDNLMSEIYDEIILNTLPPKFGLEEIEISICQNKQNLLNNSIDDLIERMVLNGWIMEEGPNQFKKIEQ